MRRVVHTRTKSGDISAVRVEVPVRESLAVPEHAVERVGQLEFVTVVGEGGPERRMVTTGPLLEDGLVEVLSGLTAGEQVALPSSG